MLFDAVDEVINRDLTNFQIWYILEAFPKSVYSIHNGFRRSRGASLRVFDHSGSFADCNTSYFNIFYFNGHRFCSASVFQGGWYLSLAGEDLSSRKF